MSEGNRVRVLPVFFVPTDQPLPTEAQSALFLRHLNWSRDRYAELLGQTFELEAEPVTYFANFPLLTYADLPEDAAPQIVAELLRFHGFNRFTCPYIYATVLMNPCENNPAGGGRPLNGGFNEGGGIVVMPSFALDHLPNFQSTLQHELGHAFGLLHTDVYGRSLEDDDSMMSYNPAHHTRFLEPSGTPAVLGPHEIAALSRNQRVFPGLAATGAASEYAEDPSLSSLGPQSIPDEVELGGEGEPRGYELFRDGERIEHVARCNRFEALAWFATHRALRGGEGELTATFEGDALYAEASGYELFFDGVRAGHEPALPRDEAAANLEWNVAQYKESRVVGRFNGALLYPPPPPRGFEMFFDGGRVSHEPDYTLEQAAPTLEANKSGDTVVMARFNGVPVV